MKIMSLFAIASFFLMTTSCTSKNAEKAHTDHGPLGHRFEEAEKWAKRWEGPERDAWQQPDEIIRILEIKPGMTVADLGAGTGYFLPYLSAGVGEEGKVFALDIEPDMIRYMKERVQKEKLSNVTPKLVPFDNPSLPVATVDRVMVVNTWHHIPNRDQYLQKLFEGLSEKGSVFIIDFTKESDIGPPQKERISPVDVKTELQNAGFQSEIIEENLSKQYIVVGRKN